MIFNVYKCESGSLAFTEIGSTDDKMLSSLKTYKLNGTIDLPITKEVEKTTDVRDVRLLEYELGEKLGCQQIVIAGQFIPNSAYDIEVHYKIKE